MFWNKGTQSTLLPFLIINRKHEMFWNYFFSTHAQMIFPLTVNMKCFEISTARLGSKLAEKLTVNMKCFEIKAWMTGSYQQLINRKHEMFWNAVGKHDGDFPIAKLTVNMKCFEMQI